MHILAVNAGGSSYSVAEKGEVDDFVNLQLSRNAYSASTRGKCCSMRVWEEFAPRRWEPVSKKCGRTLRVMAIGASMGMGVGAAIGGIVTGVKCLEGTSGSSSTFAPILMGISVGAGAAFGGLVGLGVSVSTMLGGCRPTYDNKILRAEFSFAVGQNIAIDTKGLPS